MGRTDAAHFFQDDEYAMTHRFADIARTDGVKAVQGHYGSRANNERLHDAEVLEFGTR